MSPDRGIAPSDGGGAGAVAGSVPEIRDASRDGLRNPRTAARVPRFDGASAHSPGRPTLTDETSDEALAVRATGGDAEAFRVLYERYRKMVYNLALKTLGTDADAEDALQRTFLRVHQSLPSFRGDSKLSTWIWRVALSVALTEHRSRRRRPAAPLGDSEGTEPASSAPSPADAAAAQDDAALLRRHLEALPRRDRAILHLRYQEGKSFEEISQLMELPVGTAKSLVFRAKAELRRNMERDGHAM